MISRPRCAPNCWIFLVGITMGTNTSWHNNSEPIPMLIVWRQAPWEAIRMGALTSWKLKPWSLGGDCFVNRQQQDFSEAIEWACNQLTTKTSQLLILRECPAKKTWGNAVPSKRPDMLQSLAAGVPRNDYINGSRLLGRKCKPCNHKYWSFTKNCPWLSTS